MAIGLATTGRTEIEDPPLARFLFGNPRAAPLWLVLRVFLGYQWLIAGWHKVQDPAWMTTGEALKGFWTRAVALPAAPARRPSPSTGTAASCSPCSTPRPTPGSRRWSPTARC